MGEPQSVTAPSIVIDRKHRYFIGKDYSNCYEKDFDTLDRYGEGNFFYYSSVLYLFMKI